MSTRIFIYLDPGSPTKSFELYGPNLYAFVYSETTNALSGTNEKGEEIYRALDPDEQQLIQPTARVFEERLTLKDPVELRRVLMKCYDLVSTLVFSGDHDGKRILRDPKPYRFFDWFQQDIAGAILICTRAIDEGKQVYWALG